MSAGAEQNGTARQAVRRKPERDRQRRRSEQCPGDDRADLERREAEVREVPGEQHAHEPVREPTKRARNENPPRVRARVDVRHRADGITRGGAAGTRIMMDRSGGAGSRVHPTCAIWLVCAPRVHTRPRAPAAAEPVRSQPRRRA